MQCKRENAKETIICKYYESFLEVDLVRKRGHCLFKFEDVKKVLEMYGQ